MNRVGDYEWMQLSMWDRSPENSVQKFINSSDDKHTFHFYLRKCIEVLSDTHTRWEILTSPNGVPKEILQWRSETYFHNGDHFTA